jgi:hypothetical protein
VLAHYSNILVLKNFSLPLLVSLRALASGKDYEANALHPGRIYNG